MVERELAESRDQNREKFMKSLSEWNSVTVCMALNTGEFEDRSIYLQRCRHGGEWHRVRSLT